MFITMMTLTVTMTMNQSSSIIIIVIIIIISYYHVAIITIVIFTFVVISRPDMTFAVDWALKPIIYLSVVVITIIEPQMFWILKVLLWI